MRFDQVKVLSAGDMSTSLVSIGVDLNQLFVAAFQAVWTGVSVTGVLSVQISNDIVSAAPGPDPAALVVNWSTYANSSSPVNGPGNFVWNLVNAGYRWVRIAYSPTSGAGTLNVTFTAKG